MTFPLLRSAAAPGFQQAVREALARRGMGRQGPEAELVWGWSL